MRAGGMPSMRWPAQADLRRLAAHEPGDGAQHRALARAVGAEQRHHLARRRPSGSRRARRDRAVVDAQLLDRQQRLAARRRRPA